MTAQCPSDFWQCSVQMVAATLACHHPPAREFGPIGNLLSAVHQHAMAFTPELYLHDRPGPPIDFIHGPHQWINATIRTRAVRARDAAGELTRPVSLCLSHIGLGLAWRLLRTTD